MRHVPHRLATALLLALPLAACNSSAKSDAEAKTPAAAQAAPAGQPVQTLTSAKGQIRVTQVARGLAHPWSLAFLPDGSMLVTERGGALRRVGTDGAVSAPISGVPKVFATGQGGLLDVVLADGRVEASGTHAQLMAQGGRYAELFELQAAGYR